MEGLTAKVVKELQVAFSRGIPLEQQYRRRQLDALEKLLTNHRQDLFDALSKDLSKPYAESTLCEYSLVMSTLSQAKSRLSSWMKIEPVKGGLANVSHTTGVVHEPFGVVLIISPWNYPLLLTLQPLIGAISAGNCVILKPSEISSNTSSVLAKLLGQYLDQSCYRVIEGDAAATSMLLQQRFDMIMFTGSTRVGRIVLQAAAVHLTPVVLELGGKCPVYVDRTCDLRIAAKRILFGKLCNAGQTCVAPDYILCSEDVAHQLVTLFKEVLLQFYGHDIKKSPDYGRIINLNHLKRLQGIISACSDKVVIGGEVDPDTKFIAPTVMMQVSPDDAVMQDEIFGPILPIVTVSDSEEAIQFISKREKPLAVYLFSQDKTVCQEFMNRTSSGTFSVNDTITFLAVPNMPFGGVGASGMGRYHGDDNFKAFSNKKSVFMKPEYYEVANRLMYPPYSTKAVQLLEKVLQVPHPPLPSWFSFLMVAVLVAVISAIAKII